MINRVWCPINILAGIVPSRCYGMRHRRIRDRAQGELALNYKLFRRRHIRLALHRLTIALFTFLPHICVSVEPSTAVIEVGGGQSILVPYFDDVEISIDGLVEEAAWAQVPSYDNMLVMDPDSLATPRHATVSRFLYTRKGLYVSAVMEQPPASHVVRLSSRDEFINRDSYGITLDTSGEGLYGYWFEVNLGGSVMDGKVAPERALTSEWDGPWRSATAEQPDGWSTELFLPWSMMAMPVASGDRRMGFWVNRKVAYMDERYGWPALPFASARFMSALQPMDIADVNPRQQWAVFPYTSVTYDNIIGDDEYRAGFDSIWQPSSNLQITATVNPDFGTVESDDVVVNLTAFETFFAEKRLFFLEGTEVFTTSPRSTSTSSSVSFAPTGSGARRPPFNGGFPPTTILNTRRVGGAAADVEIPEGVTVSGVELSKPTDLIGAAKVVGQSGAIRYGFLAAFEEQARLLGTTDATGQPVTLTADGRDFGVARVLYETSGAGRRSIGYLGTLVQASDSEAVVHGVDTHFLSANGKWTWDTQLLHSDTRDEKGYGMFTDVNWTPATGYRHSLALDLFDEKLDVSDLGFLRRNDSLFARYSFSRSTSQGLPNWLRNLRYNIFAGAEQNNAGLVTRGGVSQITTLMFHDRSEVNSSFTWFIPNWDDRNSHGNGDFKVDSRLNYRLSYGTDSAKPFSWSVQAGIREEELGGNSYTAEIGWSFRPIDRVSLDVDLLVTDRDGWLVYQEGRDFTTFSAIDLQPRVGLDVFLTASHHLRLTLQWAGIEATEQEFWQVPIGDGPLQMRAKLPSDPTDNFTISRLTSQLRYRWEIGPLSDLFVVWTRGGNLDNRIEADFDDLFRDVVAEPIVDRFIVKLRYRFGS